MNTRRKHAPLVGALAALSFASITQGAVLLDPVTVSGANAIDPAGSETTDQSAFTGTPTTTITYRGTLEALSGFQAVQTFTANGGSIAAGANVIAFTDPTLPDFQITPVNDAAGSTAGVDVNFNQRATSGTSAISLTGNTAGTAAAPATASLNVIVGNYDPTSTVFTAGGGVQAIGFTLANVRNGQTVYATFYGLDGTTVLGQEKIYGNDNDTADGTGSSVGSDVYFGFETPDASYSIGRFQIDRVDSSNGTIGSGFDDFGFTPTSAVPEPATAGVIVMAAGALTMRRRAR